MMFHFLYVLAVISGLTGKIQGRVTDAATGEPIPYVNVIVTGTQVGTSTDENGDFFILNIVPGTYALEISCVGFQTQKITNIEEKIHQTARLTIELKQSLIEIEPITVIYEKPVLSKDMTGPTYTIRQATM